MNYAQLVVDTAISANWIMAILLGVAIYFQKRSNDKADLRERKIDEMLTLIQKQVNDNTIQIELHRQKLENL